MPDECTTVVLSRRDPAGVSFLMPRSRRLRARCRTSGAAVWRRVRVGLAVVAAACSNGVDPEGTAVDTVVIVPEAATVTMGATITLQAEARDESGNLLNRTAFWSAADSTIVSVSADGQVTGRKLGRVDVAASIEGKSGLSKITVSRTPVSSVRLVPANASIRVGGTFTFNAEARDGSGALLSGRAFTWTSSNPAVATVTSSGRVTALSAGATIISADCEGRGGLASVNVTGGVASVRVTPTSVSLQTGETQQLVAQTLDASNTPLTGHLVTWSTSSAAVASVTTSGIVAGIGSGSATITATSEGRSGTVSVSVTPSIQPTVTISPSSSRIDRGKSVQLNAVYRDNNGRVVERNFQWSTSDSQIATVSSSGRVTGRAVGTVTITATTSGVSGSATVTVRK